MSNQCPATCHSYTVEPEAGFSLIKLKEGEKVQSPGMKYKHYAPNANVTIIKSSLNDINTSHKKDISHIPVLTDFISVIK